MDRQSPPKPDKFTGLTEQEAAFLKRQSERRAKSSNEQTRKSAEFEIERSRIGFLFAHALDDLKDSDQKLYQQILGRVRVDQEKMVGVINTREAKRLDGGYIDPNHLEPSAASLRFYGNIFSSEGKNMREQLIEWLRLDRNAKNHRVLALLEEMDALHASQTIAR